MFNLAFISHFYAVVSPIIQTFQPKDVMLSNSRCDASKLKIQCFQTQDAMRSLLLHAMRSLCLNFYEKLHYLLDS